MISILFIEEAFTQRQQDSIPVGCVPTAAVSSTPGGVWYPWGIDTLIPYPLYTIPLEYPTPLDTPTLRYPTPKILYPLNTISPRCIPYPPDTLSPITYPLYTLSLRYPTLKILYTPGYPTQLDTLPVGYPNLPGYPTRWTP